MRSRFQLTKGKGDIMSNEELSLYEQMGGTYKEMDGLYYPNIEIEDVSRFCGKYGDMWKKYMMENHHVRYRSLMLDGKLNEIAMEVNEEAHEMIDSIEERYFEKHKLQNSASTIEMWQVREMIKTVAEETILSDIVYKTR
jgi:hypothetical protein